MSGGNPRSGTVLTLLAWTEESNTVYNTDCTGNKRDLPVHCHTRGEHL